MGRARSPLIRNRVRREREERERGGRSSFFFRLFPVATSLSLCSSSSSSSASASASSPSSFPFSLLFLLLVIGKRQRPIGRRRGRSFDHPKKRSLPDWCGHPNRLRFGGGREN
ncbi:hypothetical protein GW17_00014636 [Ensete ventricosum]|nr:hypothetical protein GW17_00014636 [Ensete ventricosum]